MAMAITKMIANLENLDGRMISCDPIEVEEDDRVLVFNEDPPFRIFLLVGTGYSPGEKTRRAHYHEVKCKFINIGRKM